MSLLVAWSARLAAEAPPLDPSSPEAKRWAERELSELQYQEQRGIIDRLIEWLMRNLDPGAADGPGLPAPLLWLLLGALMAVVVVLVVRTLRAEPRQKSKGDAEVFGSDVRTAAEHRDRARRALAAGDHDTAVLEAFRALARGGVERTLLDDLPGLTSHEVVAGLGRAFPDHVGALGDVADVFDETRYGDLAAGPDEAAAAVALDGELAAARPRLPDLVAPGGGAL